MMLLPLLLLSVLAHHHAAAAAGETPLAASLLGVNAGGVTPAQVAQLKRGGFTWIRNDVPWPATEPSRGKYDFAPTDAYFQSVRDHDMRLISILSSRNPLYDGGAPVSSDVGLAAMARYAVALAKRYAADAPADGAGSPPTQTPTPVLWEMTNEPNGMGGYLHDAALYANMTAVVADAVHAAVDGAQVVGPATANTGFAWMQQIFEAGALKHFDRVTIHPYRSDAPETAWDDLDTVAQLVREYAPMDKAAIGGPPVLSGEWGYGAFTVGGKMQEAMLFARVLLLTTAKTGQPSIWYQACGPDVGEGEMGIMACSKDAHGTETFAPYPAYYAAQHMSALFRNDGKAPGSAPLDPSVAFRFVERLPVFQNGINTDDDFVLLYASEDGSDALLVAWTSSDFGHVVRLPGVVDEGACFAQSGMFGDRMGKDPLSSTVCHDPRGLHVNVTSAPRYLLRTQKKKETVNTAAKEAKATLPCTSPSTKGLPFCDTSLAISSRASDLVSRLTTDEKLAMMMSGQQAAPRLGVNGYDWGDECLHGTKLSAGEVPGLRGATIFPQPIGLGASFSTELLQDIGEAISTESRALSNSAAGRGRFQSCWSPNMNLFRDPRWGRGSETYGEDPVLTSNLTRAFVTGLRGKHPGLVKVSAVCKHFAAYSLEESDGQSRFWFNASVNPQDLEDTYLPAFKTCVESGATGIMASYNQINNVPMVASPLLDSVLRGKWGFQGHVVSDCGAVGNVALFTDFAATKEEAAAKALRAGTDMNCGGAYAVLNVSIARGLASMSDVDAALGRTLAGRFARGEFDPVSNDPWRNLGLDQVGSAAHVELAERAARESLVLLKNVGKRLPLDTATFKTVAVIGHSANDSLVMLGNYHGDPSSEPVTPLAAINAAAQHVVYAKGCWVTGEGTWDFPAAIEAARKADVAVLFVGGSAKGTVDGTTYFDTTEKEGLDRTDIALPSVQADMIKAIAAQTDTPIVLVLVNGGPLAIEWAVASPRVEAILEAFYPGQRGGNAIADALFGRFSPAGRLPVSMYHANYTGMVSERVMDMRAFPGRTHRFLQVPVLFPFGFGLSYTAFEYVGALRFSPSTRRVSVTVRNTGKMVSDHCVIVYSTRSTRAEPATSGRDFGVVPQRSVAAFTRLRDIGPGMTRHVSLTVDAGAFALVDTDGRRVNEVSGSWRLFVVGDDGTSTVASTHVLF